MLDGFDPVVFFSLIFDWILKKRFADDHTVQVGFVGAAAASPLSAGMGAALAASIRAARATTSTKDRIVDTAST